MNHAKHPRVSSQHYKERDGETVYSLFNTNIAAAWASSVILFNDSESSNPLRP